MTRMFLRGFAAGVLCVALVAGVERVAAAGTFDLFPGTWSGTGTISLSDGSKERIRCRATYRGQGGSGLEMSLGCTSDSYRFDLTGRISANGDGGLAGQWSEATRNASGSLSGRARGDHIQLLAESSAFAADMQMTTKADRQTVSIRSKSGDIADVSITLRKGSR